MDSAQLSFWREILFPLLGSFILALVILVLVWLRRRSDVVRPAGAWEGALGLAAGYLVTQFWLVDWNRFPPAQGEGWLLYFTLAAAVVGLCMAFRPRPAWLGGALTALLLLVVVGLLLRPQLKAEPSWTPGELAAWVAALAAAGLLVWAALESLARRFPGASVPLVLLLVTGGSAAVLASSGSAKLGQLAAGLAAALAASLLVAWWRPAFSLARGAVPVPVVLLVAFWLRGSFFSSTPAASTLLLAAAPLTAWLTGMGIGRHLSPWKRVLAQAAAALLPVAVALALALKTVEPAAPGEDLYDY